MRVFHGLAAFPITPANASGRVDVDTLARLLERLKAAQVDSIGLLGSTGTYAYLTRAERRRTIETATACLGGSVPVIAGIGALRTDDAQDLARDAEAAGADALLLAPVSYTPLTDDEVFEHFVAVASATKLPLCIYNNPGTTHFTVNDALLYRLAGVPRIVAVKNPAPAPAEAKVTVESLRRTLPAEFAVGYSGDWHAPKAVLAGGAAWYSVLAGVLPSPCLAILRAAQARDEAAVRRLDKALKPIWELFKQHGSIRVAYAMCDLLGLTDVQPPRPILPLGLAERGRIEQALSGLEV